MADLPQDIWAKQFEADDNAVLLDVRTAAEMEDGYIPNAGHIDILQGQEFMTAVEALDKTKNYYVYCRSGARSRQACDILNQLGIENAYNLIGGFSQWTGDSI